MPEEVTQVPAHRPATPKPIDPRAEHITLRSKILGIEKSFYIALPPGYNSAEEQSRRYPTLYLFRGHEHEWVHRHQDKSRRGRTVIDVYRALLEEGLVGPLILVFPGISSNDNRVPGLLVNFREPERAANEPGVGTGRFEDYFMREVVPYVDSNFRTIEDRAARAVDGFSLGGFQSIKIAAQYPDMFCSAGALDGTFLFSTREGKAVRLRDRVLNNPMFDAAFGSPRDLDHVAANSPANLVAREDAAGVRAVQWLIQSGPEEAEPWHSNYFRAQHVIELLSVRSASNNIEPVLEGSNHTWHWADKHMEATLPLHWHAMQAAYEKANEEISGRV